MTGWNALEPAAKVLVGFAPVLLFLLALRYLDSYKLVALRRIVRVVVIGCAVALLSYAVNLVLLELFSIPQGVLARAVAPLIEEVLKCALIVLLIRRRRIGFLVDAAIQGFAVGTGFAIVENSYYFAVLPESNVILWMIRGFGTAIMHGGTTAIFAVMSKGLARGVQVPQLRAFVPGFLLAVSVHLAFNNFLVSPVVATLFVIAVLPTLFVWVFMRSEKKLKQWLGSGFDLDIEVLRLIHSGEFAKSAIGLYLASLRQFYDGPVLADMLCYLRLRTELSLRAKGILMLRENGFAPPHDPEIPAALEELRHLERTIGKTAFLSLTPLIRSSNQDLWQLEVLETE